MKPDWRGALVGFALGFVGFGILVIGLLMQFNPFGEVAAPRARMGVTLSIVGPLLSGVGGLLGCWLVRGTLIRVVLCAQTVVAMVLVALISFSQYAANEDRTRRAAFSKLHSTEMAEFARLFEDASRAQAAGTEEVRIIGHYAARNGSIVDLYVLGSPKEVAANDLKFTKAEVLRLDRVDPVNAIPLEELGLPTPETEEASVRRFLALLQDVREGSMLVTPYGEQPLPNIETQPVAVVMSARWADQRTPENRQLIR